MTGNRHARRLLIEAAWHYRHAPRRPAAGPEPDERAWQAQVRLYHRYRHLTEHGKRSTVANVAVARELVGFLWAAMTDQPLRATDNPSPVNDQPEEAPPPSNPPTFPLWWGRAARCDPPGGPSIGSMRFRLASLVRGSSRPDTVLRSRPAHLRVTVVVALAPAARPHHPPP